jgi:quercetin dioxygenase-like cupin family protein
MLLVVEGEGWVKGEDRVAIPIRKGQLALWEPGEWHETSTENGMVAINIESDRLKPFTAMQLVQISDASID